MSPLAVRGARRRLEKADARRGGEGRDPFQRLLLGKTGQAGSQNGLAKYHAKKGGDSPSYKGGKLQTSERGSVRQYGEREKKEGVKPKKKLRPEHCQTEGISYKNTGR